MLRDYNSGIYYRRKRKRDWRIDDKVTLALNDLNKIVFDSGNDKFYDEAYAQKELTKIMRKKKCKEYEAACIFRKVAFRKLQEANKCQKIRDLEK